LNYFVTSAKPRTSTDVLLKDWQTSGLRVPSTVRLSRLDCLEQSLLLFRLGHIYDADAQKMQNIGGTHIKPQF
jgi:mRNA interferase MazF